MFLFSTGGILRGECLFSAELSDCFLISHKNPDKDPHEWDALIMTIVQGKTNSGNKIYGRAIRAKDVRLCPLGALGYYLLARFNLTKEFEPSSCPDFRDNASWYGIKLLVGFGTGAEGRKKQMSYQSYYNFIKKILLSQGIGSNHFQHLGRVVGSAKLQFKEIDDDLIRQLGNWQVSVRDLAYSTNLSLKAMRAAADFTDCDGMFFCPRR